MIISRIFASLGRKLCLFVYYVEQINNKEWMVKKIMTLNESMWSMIVEGRIKRRV
jgi:hypothetical protein